MSWTEERVQLLSRLWLEGKSASQISAVLGSGVTRNAVIGKVHRLGLAGRVKSVEAVGSVAAERRVSMEALDVAMAPRRRVAGARGGSVLANPMPLSPAARSSGAAPSALTAPHAKPDAERPVRAPDDVVIPMSLRVTIVELRDSMCKWPLGDPSSADFRYCGSAVHSGTPYCPYHGKLAYQPTLERRRDRERDRRPLLAR